MKAFVAGTCVMVLLAVVAAFALQSLGMDSSTVFSSPNVRL